uniref:Uncharacterized protein n=1 Tax=Chromera velia CCMP2878 TaxID=1169474 RepID=A0A0G4EYI8_9ALVE|eukprot:Cvel_14220.t1-p1 / transcript=Cvel_14220.t1 / gene=Cvel_14220 / organism=Chromera_velia_CCMP2878 / gene_product=hypothetical protein / transcript_product=hypothetical protein / location=Cvel_scaffold1003:14090-17215(-) / protein_length=821 / sequence_SO=supercontig / SO=protein_coding / is_pseudo=false
MLFQVPTSFPLVPCEQTVDSRLTKVINETVDAAIAAVVEATDLDAATARVEFLPQGQLSWPATFGKASCRGTFFKEVKKELIARLTHQFFSLGADPITVIADAQYEKTLKDTLSRYALNHRALPQTGVVIWGPLKLIEGGVMSTRGGGRREQFHVASGNGETVHVVLRGFELKANPDVHVKTLKVERGEAAANQDFGFVWFYPRDAAKGPTRKGRGPLAIIKKRVAATETEQQDAHLCGSQEEAEAPPAQREKVTVSDEGGRVVQQLTVRRLLLRSRGGVASPGVTSRQTTPDCGDDVADGHSDSEGGSSFHHHSQQHTMHPDAEGEGSEEEEDQEFAPPLPPMHLLSPQTHHQVAGDASPFPPMMPAGAQLTPPMHFFNQWQQGNFADPSQSPHTLPPGAPLPLSGPFLPPNSLTPFPSPLGRRSDEDFDQLAASRPQQVASTQRGQFLPLPLRNGGMGGKGGKDLTPSTFSETTTRGPFSPTEAASTCGLFSPQAATEVSGSVSPSGSPPHSAEVSAASTPVNVTLHEAFWGPQHQQQQTGGMMAEGSSSSSTGSFMDVEGEGDEQRGSKRAASRELLMDPEEGPQWTGGESPTNATTRQGSFLLPPSNSFEGFQYHRNYPDSPLHRRFSFSGLPSGPFPFSHASSGDQLMAPAGFGDGADSHIPPLMRPPSFDLVTGMARDTTTLPQHDMRMFEEDETANGGDEGMIAGDQGGDSPLMQNQYGNGLLPPCMHKRPRFFGQMESDWEREQESEGMGGDFNNGCLFGFQQQTPPSPCPPHLLGGPAFGQLHGGGSEPADPMGGCVGDSFLHSSLLPSVFG